MQFTLNAIASKLKKQVQIFSEKGGGGQNGTCFPGKAYVFFKEAYMFPGKSVPVF